MHVGQGEHVVKNHPLIVFARTAQPYELEAALLIYRNKNGDGYVSSHPIVQGPSALELGAGHPLERSELRKLLKGTGRDLGVKGWVDSRVVFMSGSLIAWWRPAAPAPMFFQANAIGSKARSGTCPQPSLVFAVADSGWYVWALKGNERPTPQTPLMRSPYLNVWNEGRICEGNVKRPRVLTPETIAAFERTFFESRFTHANQPDLCKYAGGAKALWQDLLLGKHPAFPDECLLPQNQTLAGALERAARRENDDE